MRKSSLITLIAALLVIGTTQSASAAISNNTINPSAKLSADGRTVLVYGPIACTAGEQVEIRVIVKQGSSLPIASGSTTESCTGDVQKWAVQATTTTHALLEEGAAQVCARAITYDGTTATDGRKWCAANDVTLVKLP